MNMWERLQALPFEVQAPLAVTLLVALGAFLQWVITEVRQGRRHDAAVKREEQWDREEQERREHQAQADLRAKQACFSFGLTPSENPVGVGQWGLDRMLTPVLKNTGRADAVALSVRAFLNGAELPHLGSSPREVSLARGEPRSFHFSLPDKVEPADQEVEQRFDEAIADATARFDVTFTDDSAANRVLTYCFRFERAPSPQWWKALPIDCVSLTI